MDFLQKNKKALAVTVGTTAILSLIYYFINSGEEEESKEEDKANQKQNKEPADERNSLPSKKPQEEKVKRSKRTNDEDEQPQAQNVQANAAQSVDFGEDKLNQLAKQLQQKNKGQANVLDFQSIAQILELSIDLAECQYKDLTIENRKQRRAIMRTDPDVYEKLILSYNDEVDNAISEAQDKILVRLQIEKEVFEQSVVNLMESGYYQQVYMLQAAVRQKIKEKIPATKQLNNEQAKDVIRYQVVVLKENPDFFKKIIQKLQGNPETAQMIPLAINTMLQDLIFEKFEIEEEDQMKNLNGQQLIADPEVQPLLIEIEDAMYQLMGSMGMGGMGGMGGFDENAMLEQMEQNY